MVRLVGLAVLLASAAAAGEKHQKCGDMKELYKDLKCCKAPAQKTGFQAVPFPDVKTTLPYGANPCLPDKAAGKGNPGLANIDCKQAVRDALEQAGGDISKNANG